MDLTKRCVIESSKFEPFIIEFTAKQNIRNTEQLPGMDAFECFMLDEDLKPSCRVILFCEILGGRRKCLTLFEEGKINRSKVSRIIPIEDNDTIENAIEKADECNGLTMGDIC